LTRAHYVAFYKGTPIFKLLRVALVFHQLTNTIFLFDILLVQNKGMLPQKSLMYIPFFENIQFHNLLQVVLY
jgi:hypothetical protein